MTTETFLEAQAIQASLALITSFLVDALGRDGEGDFPDEVTSADVISLGQKIGALLSNTALDTDTKSAVEDAITAFRDALADALEARETALSTEFGEL